MIKTFFKNVSRNQRQSSLIQQSIPQYQFSGNLKVPGYVNYLNNELSQKIDKNPHTQQPEDFLTHKIAKISDRNKEENKILKVQHNIDKMNTKVNFLMRQFLQHEQPEYKPYINLSKKLGKFISNQLSTTDTLKSLQVVSHGQFMSGGSQHIIQSVIRGFYGKQITGQNKYNPLKYAKQQKVNIIESMSNKQHPDTKNAITVKCVTENSEGIQQTTTLIGSCFFKYDMIPYMINLNGHEMYVPLKNNVVTLKIDSSKKGIIGRIVQEISSYENEILNMNNKNSNMMAVQLQNPLTEEQISQINKVEGILSVRQNLMN